MLTDSQRLELEERGGVRLTGVFAPADGARMSDRVWAALATERGVRRDEPATWTLEQPTGFQALTRAGAFAAVRGPALTGALDDLFGAKRWDPLGCWGTPLVRFPRAEPGWEVPSRQWHLDFPARGSANPRFAVRVLALLDAVEPRAGGTLVLAGSHQLVERLAASGTAGDGSSPSVRRALARAHSFLRDLWSSGDDGDRTLRFMIEGAVLDGVAVSVAELSGAPGDVFLMLPWLRHAPAPNFGRRPRLMVSHSVVRRARG